MMRCTGEPVYMRLLNMFWMSLDCKRDTVFSAHKPIIKLELVSCPAKKRAEQKRKEKKWKKSSSNWSNFYCSLPQCIGWNFWKPSSQQWWDGWFWFQFQIQMQIISHERKKERERKSVCVCVFVFKRDRRNEQKLERPMKLAGSAARPACMKVWSKQVSK